MPLDRVPLFFIHRSPASRRHRSSHPQRDGKRRYRLRHAKHLPVARVAPVHRPTRTRTPPVGFGEQRNNNRLEWKIQLICIILVPLAVFSTHLRSFLRGDVTWLHFTQNRERIEAPCFLATQDICWSNLKTCQNVESQNKNRWSQSLAFLSGQDKMANECARVQGSLLVSLYLSQWGY